MIKKLLIISVIIFISVSAFAIEAKKADYVPSAKNIEDETTRKYGEDMSTTVQKLQKDVYDDIDFLWKEKVGSWEKEWATSTAYDLNTAITRGSDLFICEEAHTSSATDEPGTGANWDQYWDNIADFGVTDTDTHISTEIQIKGWAQINGTGTPAYQDSYNTSGSVTDHGTGDYTITWDTDFANDDYVITGWASHSETVSVTGDSTTALAVGTSNVLVVDYDGTKKDATIICVIAIGDQ